MMKFLYKFAITGLIIGFIVHISAVLFDYDFRRLIPFIWILHLGIFIVWIPAVLLLRQKDELQEFYNFYKFSERKYFEIIFRDTPVWLIIIAIAGMIYAGINFVLFIDSQPGSAEMVNNEYVLLNHGQILKTLTLNEYNHFMANETRGFSGHWIAFYGLGAAILYPFAYKTEE